MNTSSHRISIVMATWNGEAFLAPQLDSLLAQTRPADEILILDDGSRDGTLALLERYAGRHAVIRLVCNEQNLGVNANFSQGLRLSQGDLVFISDQDDIWAPDKIERMLAAWQGEDLLYSNAAIIDAQDQELFPSEAEYFNFQPVTGKRPAYFLFNNCISGHNIMVTRRLIEQATRQATPSLLMYDQWLALLASLGQGIGYLPETLCRHRIHATNANNNLQLKKKKKGSRREQFFRRNADLLELIRTLKASGADTTPLAGLLQALESHCLHVGRRLFNPGLFLMLMQARAELYQSPRLGKNLRQALKTAMGGRLWWLGKF